MHIFAQLAFMAAIVCGAIASFAGAPTWPHTYRLIGAAVAFVAAGLLLQTIGH